MKQKRNEGHKLVVARRVGERWAGTLRLGDANWYIMVVVKLALLVIYSAVDSLNTELKIFLS